MIVDCAVKRKESRGLHYTSDHPNAKPSLAQDTRIRKF
jgi:aspartate oxidase